MGEPMPISRLAIPVLGALVSATACAPSASPTPTVVPAAAPAANAPTPYTADQIRAASPAGRRIEFRVEAAGKPMTVSVMSFVKSDDAGAEVESVTLDETGHEIGTRSTGRATWEELRAHASFPQSSTTIGDETITVPAGAFDCRVYTVTRGDRTMTFWFAKSLPGPPVRMTVAVAGKVVETRTLVRHLAR